MRYKKPKGYSQDTWNKLNNENQQEQYIKRFSNGNYVILAIAGILAIINLFINI